MVGIYKITNKINNKVYIGQSINILQRWKAHRSRPFNPNSLQYNSYFYTSIRKYGISNFLFEILEECKEEELDAKEQEYIQLYKSNQSEFGYNLTAGGQTVSSTSFKILDEELDEIYDLLLNSSLSQEKIAKQFNVSQRLISGINIGEYRIKPNYIYPLRQEKANKNIKYYCKDCGQEIASSQAKRCVTCSYKAQRLTNRPNRDLLKLLIRTKSFVEIAKIYNVSDNAIRKWCKLEHLPYQSKIIKQISDEEWEFI